MKNPDSFWFSTDAPKVYKYKKNGKGPKNNAKESLGHDMPSMFMYATQYPRNNANFYTVQSYPSFVKDYIATPPQDRRMYEMMLEDRPCCLYFDLEFIPQFNEHTDMQYSIAQLHKCVQNCLDMFIPFHEVVQLNAHITRKQSTHLIYPMVVFKDVQHMHTFVTYELIQYMEQNDFDGEFVVSDEHTDTAFLIDLGVYNKDRCFRMYGSRKGNKENWLLPPGASPQDPIDTDILMKSLASVVCGPSGMEKDKLIERERPPDSPTRPRTRRAYQPVGPVDDTLIESVRQQLITLHGPRHHITYECDNGNVSFTILPGLYCHIAKRFHKHNNTYFKLNLYTHKGRYQCPDVGCCKQRCKGSWGKNTYDFLF